MSLRHRSARADRIGRDLHEADYSDDPAASRRRLKDLSRRWLLDNDGLSEDEQRERHDLRDWDNSLDDRWHANEPMDEKDLNAYRQLSNPREPERLGDRGKADYWRELRGRDGLSPREQAHLGELDDWAEQHYGNAQNDAQAEWDRRGGPYKPTHDDHSPDLTGMWAFHHTSPQSHPILRRLSSQYLTALRGVAEHGPHAFPEPSDRGPDSDRPYIEHLEDARDRLRVELQHRDQFTVPDIEGLSRHDDTRDPLGIVHSGVVNPRYNDPTAQFERPTRDEAQAYKVNCQRATLAAEARARGYNVEAPGYNKKRGDKGYRDQDIADWFSGDQDAPYPTFSDPQDEAPGKSGPELWDHMHNNIASWGPGARGVVTFTHSNGGGRHIINTHVDDGGQVHYTDAQSGDRDVSNWRGNVAYGHEPQPGWDAERQSERRERPQYQDPETINSRYSPLRYMRVDDKQLSPTASTALVDRGTYPGSTITTPKM